MHLHYKDQGTGPAVLLVRVDLPGFGLSGPVAFRYAATRTGRVTALVIMNPAGIEYRRQKQDPQTGGKEHYKAVTSGFVARDYIATALRSAFTDPAQVSDALIDRKFDLMNVEGRDREGALMIARYVRGNPEQVLARVRAPELVLWGGAEKSLSLATADRFVAALEECANGAQVRAARRRPCDAYRDAGADGPDG